MSQQDDARADGQRCGGPEAVPRLARDLRASATLIEKPNASARGNLASADFTEQSMPPPLWAAGSRWSRSCHGASSTAEQTLEATFSIPPQAYARMAGGTVRPKAAFQTFQQEYRLSPWEYRSLPAPLALRFMKSRNPARRKEVRGAPSARSAASFWNRGKTPGWKLIAWLSRWSIETGPPSRRTPRSGRLRRRRLQLSPDL